MQTNLKSDDFCGENVSASTFYWTFQPGQYANTYVYGEVGVSAAGGTAGSYIRPELIGVSNFLSGRDNILTRCNPPVPALDSLEEPPLYEQNLDSVDLLVPMYTKEKRSSDSLDSIDYNRWNPLYSDPQNLRHVINEVAPQRGGFDTRNFVKLSWNPNNNGLGQVVEGFTGNPGTSSRVLDSGLCQTMLDPNRFGPELENITGYPGTNPLTGRSSNASYLSPGYPPNDPFYPFKGTTSQQINQVGSQTCGETYFSGKYYDQGSCPPVNPAMLTEDTVPFTW